MSLCQDVTDVRRWVNELIGWLVDGRFAGQLQSSEHCSVDTKECQNAQYISLPIQVAHCFGYSPKLVHLKHAKWILLLQQLHYGEIEGEKHHFQSARLELHVKRSCSSLLLLEAPVLAKMHRND